MEPITSSLLGSLFGGLFRMAPEVLKWLDRKDERKHELAMFSSQLELEKVRGEQKMKELDVSYDMEHLKALSAMNVSSDSVAKEAGPFIAGLNASVRPVITYCLFGAYMVTKVVAMSQGYSSGAEWDEILKETWTAQDWSLFSATLSFWFLNRTFEKK